MCGLSFISFFVIPRPIREQNKKQKQNKHTNKNKHTHTLLISGQKNGKIMHIL
jgi:hypothetical protein